MAINIQRNRSVPNREVQDLTNFINKLTIGKPFIIKNYKDERVLNTRDASLDEVANVLATLINELKSKGIIQSE